MPKTVREAFDGFGRELLDDLRTNANDRISDTAFEEKVLGIEKATTAMFESGVDEKTIVTMLQKHWDIRLSEATFFIEKTKTS